jgi:hypothetical protein
MNRRAAGTPRKSQSTETEPGPYAKAVHFGSPVVGAQGKQSHSPSDSLGWIGGKAPEAIAHSCLRFLRANLATIEVPPAWKAIQFWSTLRSTLRLGGSAVKVCFGLR